MNILHVINISFVLRHFIGDQFFYFPKKGYTFHVACSPSDDLPELAQYYGFSYLPTPVERKISIRKDFQSIRAICRYIRKNQIDIVVGHSPKGAMIAMIAAFLCRVPKRIYFRHGLVYETSHGFKRTMLKWIDRVTSFCATKVVCVSPSLMQQSLKDHLCPASKQVLLGNGTCGGIDTLKKYTTSASLALNYDRNLPHTYHGEPVAIPARSVVTLVIDLAPTTPIGDINADGKVDVSDVNAVINMMLGKSQPTDAADTNADSIIDVADVNAIINIMLGKRGADAR